MLNDNPWNMFGSVMKTSDGPAPGRIPTLNTAGNIITAARIATIVSISATFMAVFPMLVDLSKYEAYTIMHPSPIEIEKNACPMAFRTTDESTFEKSGLNRNRRPSPPPGIVIERIQSTMSMMNSSGIMIFAERSMPFCTPSRMMTCVSMTNAAVATSGFQGFEMNWLK